MDPKEKKVKEEELNVEETLNNAEEQPQDEQAENAAPMTHEEELALRRTPDVLTGDRFGRIRRCPSDQVRLQTPEPANIPDRRSRRMSCLDFP